MKLKLRQVFQFIIVSFIFPSLVFGPSANFVFAQQVTSTPTQTVFFTKVIVDTLPVPNKPFKITAYIETNNADDLLASISAPSGMTVTSPVVANFGNTIQQNTVQASWTLIASQPGSYSVTLLAHANFPVQDVTYNVSVNVGTPNSLVVTGVQIPGHIYPNDSFKVSLTLKNEGTISDNNVMASISVPDGLRLDSTDVSTSSTIGINEERTFNWTLFSQTPGSFTVTFFYSSTNSGSNSADVTINVGQILVPDVSVSKVTWGIYNSTAINVGPGDKFVPLTFTLQNVGSQDLYNINAQLLLIKPFDSSASGITQYAKLENINFPQLGSSNPTSGAIPAKSYFIGRLSIQGFAYPTYYVGILNDTAPGTYLANFIVNFSTGNQNMTKAFEVPISISKSSLQISSIIVKPTTAYTGDVGDKITTQIFNSGLPVDNAYVSLQMPPGILQAWGNSTSQTIGRLNTFQSVPISFFVNVANNVTAGSYPIFIQLKTIKETVTYPINFVVSEKANFQLISVDDSQISPGASAIPFKITLENTGSASAQTVSTKLLSGNTLTGVRSPAITATGNQENIGAVAAHQSFTTTFVVDVDPTLNGDQSTTLEVDWSQNTTSNTFIQTIPVPYHSNSSIISANYGGIPIGYLGIGAAIAVGISVFVSKSQKRKRTMETKPSTSTTDIVQPRDQSDDDKEIKWKGI